MTALINPQIGSQNAYKSDFFSNILLYEIDFIRILTTRTI